MIVSLTDSELCGLFDYSHILDSLLPNSKNVRTYIVWEIRWI